MAKDKDDPDLSPTPTALANNDSQQKDVPLPLPSDVAAPDELSTEKQAMYLWPDNPKLKKATAGKETHPEPQDEPSPSSSGTNSPNTLSTEEQPKTQPQSDDETPGYYQTTPFETSPLPAPAPVPVEDKEESWAMITEPDRGTTHPDLDLTDRNTLTRVLALLQNGWVLSHGRGPRKHNTCLWCRGPIESDVDMLTHAGTDDGSKCRNSWPATCLMDWINQELDVANGCKLKCPMCSAHFYDIGTRASEDFKANQGKSDPESVQSAAWLRCQLFSPLFAREAALKQGKQLIFMKGTEARKLVFLGKEKVVFYRSEGLIDPVDARNKRKWLRKHYGDNLPYTAEQLTGMGIAQSEATAIIQAYSQDGTISSPDLPADEPLELLPKFDTTWVIIDRGNNQFIMSAFPTKQAHNVIRLPCELGHCIIKDMTAQEFNVMAKANGGLLAAVKSYEPGKDEDLKQHRVLAEGWLEHLLAKNKPDGEATVKYELWKRIKDAHDVKLEFTLARDESTGAEDDDDLED